MGKRTSRAALKNLQYAQNALAGAIFDEFSDQGNPNTKHKRANPGQKYRKNLVARTPNQTKFMTAIDESVISFGIGPAGTGKTYIAVLKALEMLASNQVKKIIISRPAIEAAGEKLGFLPGDIKEKLHPYMLPIYDILIDKMGQANLHTMMQNGKIELSPLAFMRGRTFNSAGVVLDEMQNATTGQIEMALTRLGEQSKAIITGDPSQSDLNPLLSGLIPCADKLSVAECISTTRFTVKDVVRSPIVATVLNLLEK